jgi:trigger factor
VKYQIQETGSFTRTLEIEVPRERVDEEMTQVFEEFSKKAKVPGFRQGKIPRPILEKNFQPNVEQEVMERLIPSATFEALKEAKLEVVGRPSIVDLVFKPHEVMTFKAQVEIKPFFELAGTLSGLKLKAPKVKVEEDEVDHELKHIAERFSVLGPSLDRPAKMGDHVVVDFVGKIDGQVFEGGRGQAMKLTLGSGQTLPGFEQGIAGTAKGGRAEFDIDFPKDYPGAEVAGKKARFVVHVKEVRERQMPEMDEAFAKQVGPFTGMDQVRAKIREVVQEQKTAARKSQLFEQIGQQVADLHPFTPPPALVEAEMEFRADKEKENMKRRGLQLAEGSEAEAELRPKLKEPSEKRVRLSLVLEKVADRENFSVTEDEYRKEMEKVAESFHTGLEEVLAWAKKTGREEGVRNKLKEEKALNWILEHAKVEES